MEEAEVVVLIDRFGYTRSVDLSVYERNKESADAENRFVVHCLNTDKLCIFTDTFASSESGRSSLWTFP